MQSVLLEIKPEWIGFWGNVVGVALTVLVSWFIYWLTTKNERDKEETRLNEIESYVRSAIPELIKSIDAHREIVLEVEKKLSVKEMGGLFNFEIIASLNGSSFSWISRNDFYNVFVLRKDKKLRQDRIVLLARFHKNLEYLEKTGKLFTTLIEGHLTEKHNQYLNHFNQEVFNLMRLHQSLGVKFNNMTPEQKVANMQTLSVWVPVDKQIRKWQSLRTGEPYTTNENLIKPVREICAKRTDSELALDIVFILDSMNLAYRNMLAVKESVLSIVHTDKRKLERTKGEFKAFLALSSNNTPIPAWLKPNLK